MIYQKQTMYNVAAILWLQFMEHVRLLLLLHYIVFVLSVLFLFYVFVLVGWGTALQTGTSRVRFPMVSLEFFIDIIVPVALWPWGHPSQGVRYRAEDCMALGWKNSSAFTIPSGNRAAPRCIYAFHP
jgi:hypothetical protein